MRLLKTWMSKGTNVYERSINSGPDATQSQRPKAGFMYLLHRRRRLTRSVVDVVGASSSVDASGRCCTPNTAGRSPLGYLHVRPSLVLAALQFDCSEFVWPYVDRSFRVSH
jgi:hypothetical protein